MVMYILKDHRIINALINAKKQGVFIRIILERNPYHATRYHPTSIRKKLERAGIHVRWSNPNIFYLTHEKAFSVDSKKLVIMTLNQTYSAFHFNRDIGIIETTPGDILEFTKTFNADWNDQASSANVENLVWSPNNSEEKLLRLITSAKKSIYIETEALNDVLIKKILLKKAQEGVSVHLVLPKDADIILKQAVINIRHLPKEGLYLHAKLIIIDHKKVFIGSENLTHASLEKNRELGILINSKNIVQRLSLTFETDWKHAKPNVSAPYRFYTAHV